MSMKTNNNLSPVEKLRIRKARLKAEEQGYICSLDKNISHIRENFGALLIDAGWTSIKAQLPRNSLIIKAVDIVPIVLRGITPIIISFVLKKIKKML